MRNVSLKTKLNLFIYYNGPQIIRGLVRIKFFGLDLCEKQNHIWLFPLRMRS